MKQICILFAGPIGSGKSPIANYLSYKLNLPIFNNDTIRTEVREDLLKMDVEEYQKRRDKRISEILHSGLSFIYDASIDRVWKEYKQTILDQGYVPFVVSLDFSREKLIEIYKAKEYTAFADLDRTFKDHQLFLKEYHKDISIRLEDKDFNDRLETVLAEAEKFIRKVN